MSDNRIFDLFSTTIGKILCFWVLIRWKWVIILLVFGTLWNLGFFLFPKTPPPLILNIFQLKLGIFLIFWRPHPSPLFGLIPKFPRFFDGKPPLSKTTKPKCTIITVSIPMILFNWPYFVKILQQMFRPNQKPKLIQTNIYVRLLLWNLKD